MCNEPDYELPPEFIAKASQIENGNPATDTEAMIRKVAEQTGLSPESIKTALAGVGVAAFRAKGILF